MFGFINRNIKYGLVYDGDISNIDYCMDDTEAVGWWNSKPDFITSNNFVKKDFSMYGKKYTFTLPILLDEDVDKYMIDDYTDMFKGYIAKYGSMKLLSDIILGIWQRILIDYECVCITDKKTRRNWILFKHRVKQERIKPITIEDKALIILKKEFIDGYVRYEDYKMNGKSTQMIPLHQTYTIDGETIKYNYTAALRKAMFYNATKKMGRDKLMMDWQYDVIKQMARITYIVGPRRMGKTFMGGFLSEREMLRNTFSMKNELRPINIIYIGLTATKNLKVVNYIKNMSKQIGDNIKGMFHYDAAKMIYSFKSGTETLAEISFVSAESKDPGVGDYADLIIIDEAAKIPRSIFEGIEPIVLTEGAKLVCISTLYKNSTKGWFYEKLVEAEKYNDINIENTINKWYDKFKDLDLTTFEGRSMYQKLSEEWAEKHHTVGLRYTIDDIEYITEKQRERMRKEYEKDPDRYMAELYSRFPEDGKVFKYNHVLIAKEKIYMPAYKYIVIGYDPALSKDNSSVIVGGYDESRGKICVLQEYDLKKTGRYEEQIEELSKIIMMGKKLLSDEVKGQVFLAMDGTQKGTAEALQIKGLLVNLRVVWTSGNDITVNQHIPNEHRVPKTLLVEIAESLIDNNKVLINMELKGLCKEFDYYQRVETKSGGNTFEGVGDKDDKVSAFMIMCYYFYNILGIKYEIYQKEIKEPTKNTDPEELYKFNAMKRLEKELLEKQLDLRKARAEYWRNNVY